LSKLIYYTKHHFDAEEALMNKLDYARLEGHKETHRVFNDENERVLKLIQDGKSLIGDKFIRHLSNCYIQHITTEDMDAFSFKG
jgi:hemerythrin